MYKRRKKGFRKKTIILLRLGCVVGIGLLFFSMIDSRLRPVISTMAKYQCRVVSVLAMNEAVMEELERYPDIAQNITSMEKSADGTVTSIEVNAAELNRLKARLTAAVSLRLMELENQTISIPIGTLMGWQIFAGRGPDVHLQVVPASFVHTVTNDLMETAGINQTRHRVMIQFSVEMSAILPGYSTNTVVENEVCVSETLIVGKVPQFYAVTG